MKEQRCNDYMDCPNGKDEVGCGTSYNKGKFEVVSFYLKVRITACFFPDLHVNVILSLTLYDNKYKVVSPVFWFRSF